MIKYYNCIVSEEVIDTEINTELGIEDSIKLGTNLKFEIGMLSDVDRDYFVKGMERLLRDREMYMENVILKEQVQHLNERVGVLENAHKIRTSMDIQKIRNSIDI
ncbi:MAG: hypothetical protein ACRCX2_10040 [Paraclostridium sp.]